MIHCAECDREWPSKLAAEDCADQDRWEDDDRKHGRMFRVHRGIN